MLVDGTIPVGAARVCEIAPHAALEEALAALACELAVVLAARLVATHNALDVLLLLLVRLTLRRLVCWRGLRVAIRRSLNRSLRGRRRDLRGREVQLARLRGRKV